MRVVAIGESTHHERQRAIPESVERAHLFIPACHRRIMTERCRTDPEPAGDMISR
jgi:hypothetical protein